MNSTNNVAYAGPVKMHEARWTDKEGSTVTFKLPMKGMENQRNPFEKWTKRRKGHAGTRFACVIIELEGADGAYVQGPMVYTDEVMLAGWNDSQTTGHTVKFWLAMDQMGHPFEGYERNVDSFYLSLVELDDDQETIDQKVRDKVEAASTRPSERVSYVAAMLCKNEGFWQYIKERTRWKLSTDDPEDDAREYILDKLKITSRAELDRSNLLAQQFHDEIRKPFVEWQGDA